MTNTLEDLSRDVATLASKTQRSVVEVHARRGAPSSGIVWDGAGLVVTAAHTLELENDFHVTGDGDREVSATLVGRDPGTDVAVLRTELDLPAPDWTDTSRLAMGNLAVVVARRRIALVAVNTLSDGWTARSGSRIDRYIEIDPKRFRGFSGSLLVDPTGGALGMNTIGLARRAPLTIPTETIRRVVATLLEHGTVRRGFVGITTSPVRVPDTVTSQDVGLMILDVQPGSPAAAAPLFLGDVVLAVDDEIIESPAGLLAHLSQERIGQEVGMRILRAGEEHTVSFVLGERP